MEHRNWTCPKCGNRRYEVGEIRTAGGFWSKIFDMQNRRFSSVSCSRCHYTEFDSVPSSGLGNVFDLFTN